MGIKDKMRGKRSGYLKVNRNEKSVLKGIFLSLNN